jgi:hypothetical protein
MRGSSYGPLSRWLAGTRVAGGTPHLEVEIAPASVACALLPPFHVRHDTLCRQNRPAAWALLLGLASGGGVLLDPSIVAARPAQAPEADAQAHAGGRPVTGQGSAGQTPAQAASVKAQTDSVETPVVAGGPAPDCRTLPLAASQSAGAERGSLRGRGTWAGAARERYLAGDVKGALEAWNVTGTPRLHCVNVDGLVRTRRASVIDYLEMSAGDLLTAGTLGRLERRLGELPVGSRSQLRFDPTADGSTTLTPIVIERSLLPEGLYGWGTVGIRSLFVQEVRVPITSAADNGEVWTPSYRWARNRPRAMLRFEAPAPGRLPGIVHVQTFVEQQAYQYSSLGTDVFRQSRLRVGTTLSDWATGWLRWEGGAAYDRIGDTSYVAIEGSLNARTAGDRVAVIVSGARWAGGSPAIGGTGVWADGGASFSSGEIVATARSTAKPDLPVVTTLVGVAFAGDAAPLVLWPAASSGEGQAAVLRAHPLRHQGIIDGEVFGRTIAFMTTEYVHPVHTKAGLVGIAGFVDAARVSRRLASAQGVPLQVDVGAGVRFNASSAGRIRLDVAVGVRDGSLGVSAGYMVPWGTR